MHLLHADPVACAGRDGRTDVRQLRVSLHHATSEAEVEQFLAVLPDVVADVRAELGATGL